MDTLKEYKFNIVTTSNRNIERLEEENNTLYKEDNHKPTIVKNTENIIEKSYSSKSNYPIGNSQEKKTVHLSMELKKLLILSGGIILLLLLAIYLIN